MTRTSRTPVPASLHSNHNIVLSLARASEPLPSPGEPIYCNDDHDNRVYEGNVVHSAGRDRFNKGKAVHDEREQCPGEGNDVGEEANRTEPEGAGFDGGAAFDEEKDNRNGVAKIEKDDAGSDHTPGS
jgi:hypothetical protein